MDVILSQLWALKMRKSRHSRRSLLPLVVLLALGFSRSVLSEPPNPFAQPGQPPPNGAPPPPPPEGDEFDLEDDFGFQPPSDAAKPTPEPEPPESVSTPPPPTTPPSGGRRTARPTPPPNRGNSPTFSTESPPPTKDPGAAPAPKLADYLELDSTVKGLQVKNFDLNDQDIRDVVKLISKWTGKNFILDQKVRGKITILGPSQVTLQEAYQAFLSALAANGLTTVQSGKFIRIIESAEARRAPVKTYIGDYAPKDDAFITRIFQLQYINADEVQREFRDMTTRQGKLFAYEPTNSIIITDTGSNIQRIKEILDALDIPTFETTLHVMAIKNSNAKAIATLLDEIYGDKGGAGGRSSSQRFRRSALERTRGGGIISKIVPDEQTNSLVVLANDLGYKQLRQLVAKLDVKGTDTGKIQVYYCEYAKAEDLAATLSALSGGGGGAPSTSSRRSRSSSSSTSTPGTPPGGTSPSPSSGGGGRSGPVSAELDGGIRITSDASTNALVVTANAADFQTLKRVIKKLDIPRLQVFVETAILELNLDDTTNVGINAAVGAPGRPVAGGYIGDASSLTTILSKTGLPEGATIPIFAGPKFTNSLTVGSGTTSTTATVESNAFMGLINLLTSTTQGSILSTPQIIALDNEESIFKVQDQIPVQSTFTTTAGTTATGLTAGVGNIDYLKTGIEIKLTPHINAASGSIRLDIEQTVDSLRPSSDVPQGLANVQRAKTSRVTNTSVVVRDQDFIMLGGLMSDRVDETSKKVPLLGDVPVLGWLFKSKNFKKVKTNLVILLRPKIIGTTLDSANLVQDKLERRDQFIDENVSGDAHENAVDEITREVDQQRERGRGVERYNYRNNEGDEPTPVEPGQKATEKPKPKTEPRAERKKKETDKLDEDLNALLDEDAPAKPEPEPPKPKAKPKTKPAAKKAEPAESELESVAPEDSLLPPPDSDAFFPPARTGQSGFDPTQEGPPPDFLPVPPGPPGPTSPRGKGKRGSDGAAQDVQE